MNFNVITDRTLNAGTFIVDDQDRSFTFDLNGIAPGTTLDLPCVVPRMTAVLTTDLTYDTASEEKIIAFDTDEHSVNINLSGGEIEFLVTGRYRGDIILQIDESGDPTFIMWIEIKPVSTGIWELQGGMAKSKIKDDINFTLSLNGSIEMNAGDKMRLKGMITNSSDTLILKSISETVSLGTLEQPAASIDIFRVGDITD